MIESIELQMISKILTTDVEEEIDTLCSYDESYYSIFRDQIKFILDHRIKYGNVPDIFTFQAQFPDVTLVQVRESIQFLKESIQENKQYIILLETFNKIKELGSADVKDAWKYIGLQYERVLSLDSTAPMDIVHQARERADEVIRFSKQARIPTGFDEIDKLMYGGFSTVEELVIIVARTNSGKSWILTKMMESAQAHKFPCLYYSPEMQASFLSTRFDTWRKHFQNSQLYRGNYNEEYKNYIKELEKEETPAFILEDKDVSEGSVNVPVLESLVKRYGIQLLIIDGLSYMEDSRSRYSDRDYEKYKNLSTDLFKLSKRYGCAVVVAMQANRESKDSKDDKGEIFPTAMNIEGSDHPARIATQVFSVRQIFERHVLDIRLEKSRMANNQKPILSYSWDINTGNIQNIQGEDSGNSATPVATTSNIVTSPKIIKHNHDDSELLDDDDFDDVEF